MSTFSDTCRSPFNTFINRIHHNSPPGAFGWSPQSTSRIYNKKASMGNMRGSDITLTICRRRQEGWTRIVRRHVDFNCTEWMGFTGLCPLYIEGLSCSLLLCSSLSTYCRLNHSRYHLRLLVCGIQTCRSSVSSFVRLCALFFFLFYLRLIIAIGHLEPRTQTTRSCHFDNCPSPLLHPSRPGSAR